MDWMEFSDTQSMHTLDDEQIGVLISIALDEFGPGLTRTEFNDVMLWLFESIAASKRYRPNSLNGTCGCSGQSTSKPSGKIRFTESDSPLAIQHGLLLDLHRIFTTQMLPPCSTAESCRGLSRIRRSARCECQSGLRTAVDSDLQDCYVLTLDQQRTRHSHDHALQPKKSGWHYGVLGLGGAACGSL
jgi:hypothetical protein